MQSLLDGSSLSALGSVEPDLVFRYGEDESQSVHLYLPEGCARFS